MGKPVTRTLNISARVNQQEKDLILQKMSLSGMTNLNQYLRRMAIYGYIIEIDMLPLNELSVEMSQIGNNLNQLSRRNNQNGNIYKEDILAMRYQYKEIMGKLSQYLDKVIEATKM